MADIKSLLKDARKLIDDNKFAEAQECCKNILRKDKNNYLALVLLGKSFQDEDQAPLAFQKAITCKRDHILAWEGLASYYERKDAESKTKLISVYEEMLSLQLEEDKVIKILTKLGKLGSSTKSPLLLDILMKFMNITKDGNLYNTAENEFINLLKSDVPYNSDNVSAVIQNLTRIRSKDSGDASLELMIVKAILYKYDTTRAINEILNLSFFSTNTFVKEWCCKYICMIYLEKRSLIDFSVEAVFEKLTQNIETYRYSKMLQSIIFFMNENYLGAYKQCIPLINFTKPEKLEAIYITKCTMMLKQWSVTQKLASSFLAQVTDDEFANQLRTFLFLSLCKQQKWKEAFSVSKNMDVAGFSLQEKALLVECYIELKEPMEDLLQSLHTTEYYMPLKALMLIKKGQYEETISLLESSSVEIFLKYYYLGIAYWELKQYNNCHVNLLKSAKLETNHANTFLYLGHVYHIYMNDLERAKKCYEKAYNISPYGNSVAMSLSEIHSKLGLKNLDYELLCSLENSELKDSSWLNLRLGLHFMNKKAWEQAIMKFRNVIKSNPNNATAFECLSDAYFSRGSYMSALKAYNKVITLDSKKTMHCLTRMGYIYTLLTRYSEAISTFEQALNLDFKSVLALKGIAENWIKIAQQRLTMKMYGNARDCAQKAVDYIFRAISENKQFSTFFKMLGDTFTFIIKLPVKYSYVYINNIFDNKINDTKRVEKLHIFPYVIACYTHIIKHKKQTSSFDLALAYFTYYRESNNYKHCQIAFNVALECVKRKPSIWKNWNLLGKLCVCIRKYNFAQHCFIKALLVTRKWSVAKIWCNLGTLYLKLKLYKLSNYCYWRGQSTLPSYSQSWIGQGLIAEVIREEEAMDLFRHASRLGYHRESALGYADWVCRTLKSTNMKNPEFKYVIDGLHAVPYSIDLLQWFCTYEPNNACAYTILGILQERVGLMKSAKESYEKALGCVKDCNKNIVLMNMGRIQLRLHQNDDAVDTYKKITEATLDSVCGLALGLFKQGCYDEAYSNYGMALQWMSNNQTEKSDVLVAMAGILYMFKGPDDAKTLLFQSIQLSQKKPTPYSLFAICSLGIVHSDENLSKIAITELQKYERDKNYAYDIGFLKSYLLVCDNKIEDAITSISNSIHDHPNVAALWFCLAHYCLSASNTRAKAASACAQRALCSAQTQFNSRDNPANMLAMASIAEHMAGNSDLGLLLAKKGLHMYPQQAEIWAAFVFSLLSTKLSSDKRRWLSAAAGHMRRHLNIPRNLSRWAGIVEKRFQK